MYIYTYTVYTYFVCAHDIYVPILFRKCIGVYKESSFDFFFCVFLRLLFSFNMYQQKKMYNKNSLLIILSRFHIMP